MGLPKRVRRNRNRGRKIIGDYEPYDPRLETLIATHVAQFLASKKDELHTVIGIYEGVYGANGARRTEREKENPIYIRTILRAMFREGVIENPYARRFYQFNPRFFFNEKLAREEYL